MIGVLKVSEWIVAVGIDNTLNGLGGETKDEPQRRRKMNFNEKKVEKRISRAEGRLTL